ncbi:FAD-binding protein [Paracoccus aminophilus]|uniref:Glycolate oxidase, FAD binding subunit n=1 Tax=Paracoccus aminophilus JCM 7686 TaxID=1367847 RepID=S5Y138_PARAH|nr:FAD-binding protein [Paracoccus aminophilus]AGT09425.1 glycolate oxidase, FAD binding subunit [Paracoccus aminophilus JCM 7686]
MRPESEEELAHILRTASAPVSAIGGGTRLWPGEGEGARIDMTGLSGLTLYEPEALTLVVRAGTTLEEVRRVLATEGQMLAFEPDARPGSTIGGVAATNSSGPRRVQAGACRDAMLGLRFVTGAGEIVKNGGRVMKNVTGYDLVKLLAGSRGALGVLTEVALKTAPIPPVSRTLALPGLGPEAAVAALTSALTGPYDVSGAGWLPGQGALIRVEGLEGSVDLRMTSLRERLRAFGEISEVESALWTQMVPREAEGDLWRIICHPSEVASLLKSLPAPLAMDWGGGLLWVSLPAGEVPRLPLFNGHAARATGATPLVLPAPHPVIAKLNADLRQKFDPRGILSAQKETA